MSFYKDDFTDFEGKSVEVNWTQELWDEHLNKHPEIRSHEVASNLIREALESPSLVMEGERPGDSGEVTRCYYKEHKSSQGDVFITKVVVGCKNDPCYVKTVFQQWLFCGMQVQEAKYPNFKEVCRDEKTQL